MINRTLRRNIRRSLMLAAGLMMPVVGMMASAYAIGIEPRRVDFNKRNMLLPRLKPGFDGYRIIQISDIHFDSWIAAKTTLPQIVERINALEPDLIVITGDYVSTVPHDEDVEHLRKNFANLQAKDGVLAIMGNHDHWHDVEKLRHMLRDAGVIELRNEVFKIQRGEDVLHIAGVEDHLQGLSDIDLVTEELTGEECAVLLAHEPDVADISAATGRFDLQLSGHSHGGQIYFPFKGAMWLPAQGQKYPNGHYQLGQMQLYTNRGLGTTLLPIRFNCPPEVSIFTLRSPQAAPAGKQPEKIAV